MASQHEQQNARSKNSPQQKPQWRPNLRPPVEVNWSDVDPLTIRRCIDSAARAGGAVMFGRTSDGGAFSICVLFNDQKLKDYPHTKEECEASLLGIEAMFVGN